MNNISLEQMTRGILRRRSIMSRHIRRYKRRLMDSDMMRNGAMSLTAMLQNGIR